LRNRLQEGSIGWRRASTDRNSCTARRGRADFDDRVRVSAVIDALYASAASGIRTPVALPAGFE